MYDINSAVVEALSKDNKRVLVGGAWYGSYNPLTGVNKGDVVSFNFVKKGQWNNIKGAVEVVASGGAPSSDRGGPAPSMNSPASQAAIAPNYDKNAGYLVKRFPVPADHPDRSIIRQNAIGNAIRALEATLWTNSHVESMSHDELFVDIMGLATKFEKYATGDLELEMASEMVEKEGK